MVAAAGASETECAARRAIVFRNQPPVNLIALGMTLVIVFAAQAPAREKAGARATRKQTPAFPGAQGFGAYAEGGRGGRVIEVTNLKTSGPGSFRAACYAKGPRIVVFRVSGLIDIGRLNIREPFITIAGQTAPGDGVCLRNGQISVQTHDVILRHLRSRPGDHPLVVPLGEGLDAIHTGRDAADVIIDHCSATWGVDETLSVSGSARNVTVQWSIISEGLHDSIHPEGRHSKGLMVFLHGQQARISIHHCLLAHNSDRNPLISTKPIKSKGPSAPVVDVRNNVIHNPGRPNSCILYAPVCPLRVNYVGNVIKNGPDGLRLGLAEKANCGVAMVGPENTESRLYVKDNIWPGQARQSKRKLDDWGVVDYPHAYRQNAYPQTTRSHAPIPAASVTTEPAQQAFESVLNYAGATRPVRDVVDARVAAEVRAGTGRIINSPRDVGGYPTYASAAPPADSDHDGMPDAWEKRFGFNPSDPADGPKDLDGEGYTNVEEFLNQTHPAEPDTGRPIPQAPVQLQAGNDAIRGEAARRIGEKRLAELKTVNATEASRKGLLRKVRESGKEVADLLGINFVRIPSGEFVVGRRRYRVRHSRAFEISVCEITQAQWEAVMGTRPWHGQPGTKDHPECPVTYVNYLDCREFVKRLNACGDRKYRLPTYHEWKYAARAGTHFQYGFDSRDASRVHEYAWCIAQVHDKQKKKNMRRTPKSPQGVGRLKPNPWRLYDMAGNVDEWCGEWFQWRYHRGPNDGTVRVDPRGPDTGTYRLICGGHFRWYQTWFQWELPTRHLPYYRGPYLGFRLQRALAQGGEK